jgi:hypothetical protein
MFYTEQNGLTVRNMTEYTAKRARTRGQLLAAGQELLPGAVRRGLEHALGPGPVTQRADVSRQTWYRYWRADDSEYLDELLVTALDTVAILLGPRLLAIAESETHANAQEAATELAHAHFTLVTQRRVAIPHLVGVVLALEDRLLEAEDGIRPTSAPEIVREFQRRTHAALAEAYGLVLARWSRYPVEGMELDRIVGLIAALADGCALRQMVDPDGTTADTFAAAAVELLRSLTQPARTT